MSLGQRFIRTIFPVVGMVMLAGCATVSSIKQEYKTVNTKDGVVAREAVLIAQNQLMQSGKDKAYGIFTAKILSTPASRKYPDYWFVDFNSTDYFNRSYWAYLVLIDKKTGAIKHSSEYVPLAIADFEFAVNPSKK